MSRHEDAALDRMPQGSANDTASLQAECSWLRQAVRNQDARFKELESRLGQNSSAQHEVLDDKGVLEQALRGVDRRLLSSGGKGEDGGTLPAIPNATTLRSSLATVKSTFPVVQLHQVAQLINELVEAAVGCSTRLSAAIKENIDLEFKLRRSVRPASQSPPPAPMRHAVSTPMNRGRPPAQRPVLDDDINRAMQEDPSRNMSPPAHSMQWELSEALSRNEAQAQVMEDLKTALDKAWSQLNSQEREMQDERAAFHERISKMRIQLDREASASEQGRASPQLRRDQGRSSPQARPRPWGGNNPALLQGNQSTMTRSRESGSSFSGPPSTNMVPNLSLGQLGGPSEGAHTDPSLHSAHIGSVPENPQGGMASPTAAGRHQSPQASGKPPQASGTPGPPPHGATSLKSANSGEQPSGAMPFRNSWHAQNSATGPSPNMGPGPCSGQSPGAGPSPSHGQSQGQSRNGVADGGYGPRVPPGAMPSPGSVSPGGRHGIVNRLGGPAQSPSRAAQSPSRLYPR